MDTFIQEKPQVIEKILRAMIKAEDFAEKNPAEAIAIVATKLEISEDEFLADWNNTIFDVSINQELILEMENIAQWAINQKLTDAGTMPNFLDFVYLDGLDSVKPESITIIR
jgi:NitT/TauT family transport system substrate-binding protein